MRKNHGIVVVIVFDESVNTAEENGDKKTIRVFLTIQTAIGCFNIVLY